MNAGSEEDTTPFVFLERRTPVARVYADQQSWVEPDPNSLSDEETLLWASGGPFPRNKHLASFQGYLSTWSIYDSVPLDPSSEIREPVVARYSTRLEADGSNLINVLHTLYSESRQFKKDINAAMRAAFGDEFEELVFPPRPTRGFSFGCDGRAWKPRFPQPICRRERCSSCS